MQKVKKTALVWFRNDLRITNQQSLSNAIANHENIIGIFHFPIHWFKTTEWGFKKMEHFRASFLIQTLTQLKIDLEKINISLWITVGKWEKCLKFLIDKHNITDIYAQKEWTQEELVDDSYIPENIKKHWFYDQFLFHPDDIPFELNSLPNIFTVFRKICEKNVEIRKPLSPVSAMPNENLLNYVPPIPTLEDLGYEKIFWDNRTAIPFSGGEKEGLSRLDEYFWETKQLSYYKKTRNGLIGKNYSSKFSIWLALGSLSPITIYHEVKKYEKTVTKNNSTYWLIFELIWRDYFKYISMKYGNSIFKIGGILEKDYSWNKDTKLVEMWINGKTNEPFINANMIELFTTGFMSNRGRQNVASFFAKEWNLDWRIGASYFESMLIDYDVHSNYGNWMYNSGVGNDPRDRKFNIKFQSERYDPIKKYEKLWTQ